MSGAVKRSGLRAIGRLAAMACAVVAWSHAVADSAPLPPLPPAMLSSGSSELARAPWPNVGEPPLDPDWVPGDVNEWSDAEDSGDTSAGRNAVGPASEGGRGAGADSPGERGLRVDNPPDSAAGLEGPPVPLAPVQRLSTRARLSGTAIEVDDDKPLTLRFKQAELADILDAFSRFTGLNIIASERVRGRVSLSLTDVPWRIAFDTLLDAQGLAMSRRGNVIWVAPQAELAARERQRFETHARAADLEPLVSRTFALSYPRADELARLLTAPGAQRVLSKRGAAMADVRTNLLFVTDLKARLEHVAELVDTIDRPNRQVLIEARIVEGERGFSRELGARLSMRSAAGEAADPGSMATGIVGGAQGRLHDLSAQALAGFEAATAGLTLFAAGATRLVTAELSALEAQGRGQIVSSPRVVTADRTKALVEQGTELPYQAKVRNGVSGVQFRRASLKLEVEPRITPRGRVILDLDIAKDSVGKQTAGGPAIDTKHVRTRVEVEDGGTVSIGGIYESQDRDDVTRVPLLGKIPLIGALFRHRAVREQRSELVVFITPRIVPVD
ncbi:type IV pilus secretin PilQ [Trinickia sp.]|uniref:type IV pilus secretin PilQ n=1 Tax=Trinickia sp. TaxID=2571163 RepID=UPI003F7E71EF